MIPSKFGMAPVGANVINNHKNFSESTNTMFATPNNSKSNSKYLSELIKTADPPLPCQKERENQLLRDGIPKICSISFYPQGNEFFIKPIFDYFQSNPISVTLSFFTVPDEPCTIYFECEDPNKLVQYLKQIPDLPDLTSSPQIIADTNKFIQLFCNYNVYCHIKVGSFVQIADPEFDGDYAQVVSVNKEKKKCLLKIQPRIDYENLFKYKRVSQLELNNLMPPNYRPSKSFFDRAKLMKISNNIEFDSKTIYVGNNSEIELTIWDGKKYYGSFQYKTFHFEEIKTIIPEIPIDQFETFRKNIYSNEKHIPGFVENCEHLYSEFFKSSSITPSNSAEIELENDDINNSDKNIPLSLPVTKVPKRKKTIFTISKDPEIKQKIEESFKKEKRAELKKAESKKEHKKEEISETRSQPVIDTKSHKKESKSEVLEPPPPKITPGMTVIPNYGQYAGLLCKVISNDENLVQAEIDDTSLSIPFTDFTLSNLCIETRKETRESGVQTLPLEEETKKREEKKTTKKPISTSNDTTFSEPKPVNNKIYTTDSSQTDPTYDIIPRDNDLVTLSTGEEAMVVDENTMIISLTGARKKVKGSEVLQSRVAPENNSMNDSKGDRLNVNEEVKITKGRHGGHFASIVHVGNESLFVKFNGGVYAVKPEETRKINEDAQKVETEDILGEQIVLLKKGEIASKPMTIHRFDTDGNVFVENTYNDPIKPKTFSVKMKDYTAKWMFETEIPIEMRFGRNMKKIPKKKY